MDTQKRPSKFIIKMRKINRGIVLGAVVVVIWAIYLVVAHFRFVNSTQSIKEDAKNFMLDFYKAAESDNEGIWTQEQKDAQIDEITQVCDKYWTTDYIEQSDLYDYSVKKAGFVDNAISGYRVKRYAGNVTDTDIMVSKDKVKKFGNNGAKYTAQVKVKMNVPAYQSFPTISEYGRNVVEMSYMDSDSYYNEFNMLNNTGTILDRTVEVVVEYDVTFYYIYTDGQWKISGSEVYSYDEAMIGSNTDEKRYDFDATGSAQTAQNAEEKKGEQ